MVEIKLSQNFVKETKKEIKPHWGELGWVTYKRTYARWIEEEQRTEEWEETVKRVVEGNINLDPRLHTDKVDPAIYKELKQEAKELFRLIYGLSGAASGRNLWISGTDFQKRNGDALNNCWFVSIKPQPYGNSHIVPFYLTPDQTAVSMPFSFLFDQLMKGGGVGFSAVTENMRLMPKVDHKINLTVVVGRENGDYEDIIKAGALDKDQYSRDFSGVHNEDEILDSTMWFTVPDDREGWVIGNALVIDSHFNYLLKGVTDVVIDVTKIRERGKRIKGFGGVASGAVPYVQLLIDVNKLLNEADNNYLSSIECTDICNLIGKTVVAGNVRRSAEIALGSPDDEGFITMKQDQEKLMDHRWASNNSVIVDSSFSDYNDIADAIAHNGEPGIVNLELAQNYGRIIDGYKEGIDGEAVGTNPCGEINLCNGEPCNLFEVFPLIAEEQGWDLKEAFRLATRYAKRVTFSNYEWQVSRDIIYKNRRIGISMSGIQDWVLNDFDGRLVIGYNEDHSPVYNEHAIHVVNGLYQTVVASDEEYSNELGCNPSIKHTTVKPSGTVSKLSGVSEGVHFQFADYLIQRIRFQDNDPLLPAIKKAGYRIEDDVYSANTKVVEFLVKAPMANHPDFLSAEDVSIEEQFANQAFLQTYWSDNSVSCTITFQKDEVEKIADLFRQYRNITKSTSLLPYSGHGFKQAPKEPISKDEYERRIQEITGNVQAIFHRMHNKVETQDLEIEGVDECAGGACPIK